MGASVGWIGIEGLERPDILSAIGLVDAPQGRQNVRANIWSLPSGWTILLTLDFGFSTPERMAALSAGGRAIALSADNRVMTSVVRGYERGKAVFAIEHDSAQGPRHMASAGEPPTEWRAILDRAMKEQDQEDAGEATVDFLFDAPVELAKALCGYRHDEDVPEGQGSGATGLVAKKGPSLLGRLFGKG